MKPSPLFVLAIVVLVFVVVALTPGMEQTPLFPDQPRAEQSNAASPDATATAGIFSTSVVTALLTAALGFVVGQFVLKLLVDPIQEQRRIVGRVAHALFYYRYGGSRSATAS